MGNTWLKIKIWTKLIVFGTITLYASLFAWNNTSKPVVVWLWFGSEYTGSAFTLLLIAFFSGAIFAFLVRTILRTLWQMREAKLKSRTRQLEKEMADMKTKASMIQPRPQPPRQIIPPAAESAPIPLAEEKPPA